MRHKNDGHKRLFHNASATIVAFDIMLEQVIVIQA